MEDDIPLHSYDPLGQTAAHSAIPGAFCVFSGVEIEESLG